MTFATGCDVKQLIFEDYYICATGALLNSHLQKNYFSECPVEGSYDSNDI